MRATRIGNKFGHLFYREPFSNYVLRWSTFLGSQSRRSWGVPQQCGDDSLSAAEPMTKEQDFPVSIEVQLLGGDGQHPRTTGNCAAGSTW
jgi:hypothetical protein